VREKLEIVYPEMPPTSNKIYFRGTILTTKAREYAERFAEHMRQHLHLINEMEPSCIYALHLRFFFFELVNRSWNNPDFPPSKQAKDRYKKIDLTNRIKLLEDCVRDALAIDDSHTFASSQEKHQCGPGEPERVEITVQKISPSLFGL